MDHISEFSCPCLSTNHPATPQGDTSAAFFVLEHTNIAARDFEAQQNSAHHTDLHDCPACSFTNCLDGSHGIFIEICMVGSCVDSRCPHFEANFLVCLSWKSRVFKEREKSKVITKHMTTDKVLSKKKFRGSLDEGGGKVSFVVVQEKLARQICRAPKTSHHPSMLEIGESITSTNRALKQTCVNQETGSPLPKTNLHPLLKGICQHPLAAASTGKLSSWFQLSGQAQVICFQVASKQPTHSDTLSKMQS